MTTVNSFRMTIWCLFLALTFSACNGTDPIKEKRNSIAEELKREQQREQLRVSESYDFRTWSAPIDSKTQKEKSYLIPVAKSDTTAIELSRFWKSASNLGYVFLAGGGSAEVYPVYFKEDEASGRKSLKLETKKGRRIFGMGSHVVPGSIYNGKLDAGKLISAPLDVTLFGSDYDLVPFKVFATVKYRAGEQVIDGISGKKIEMKDKGSIAAVFYEVSKDLIKDGDDTATYLTGANLHTDPRVIAKAICEIEDTEGEDWIKISAPFTVVNQEGWDALDFKTKKYRLALVLSSSFKGDQFWGAIGSTLLVDGLEVKGEPLNK